MCMLAATTFRPPSALRLPFSRRARTQIGLFLLAYAVYTVARFFTIGDLSDATANAHWIVDLQNGVGVGVEASVQHAVDGTWVLWSQPPLPARPARCDPGGADLPLQPVGWAVYATAAQHRSWRRGCCRCRSTACSRSRRRGSRASGSRTPRSTSADEHEHDLELLDELLQRARGGAVAARRLRGGGRLRRLFATLRNPVLRGDRAALGAWSSPSPWWPRATTSSSTRSPVWRPAWPATAWR